MATPIENMLAGYDPGADVPLGTTYDYWLRNALGGSPLAYQYGQSMAPQQALQYLSAPMAGYGTTGNFQNYIPAAKDITNPFMSWLGGPSSPTDFTQILTPGRSPMGLSSPLGAQGWMNRAMDVSQAMASGNPMGIQPELREEMLTRFGAGNEASAERQRQLAYAPIMTGVSQALRGEVGNVLQRMFQNWKVERTDPTQEFLDYAMQRGEGTGRGLWQRFGLTPPGTATDDTPTARYAT